jgi:LEA14-like dessication related protein
MAKRRILFPILIAAIGLIAGCASLGPKLEPPQWRLVDMKFIDARLLEQRHALTFRIINPNDIDIPVTGMYYEVEIEGEKFASGVSAEPVTIPAYGESEVTVTVSTNLLKSMTRLAEVMNRQPEQIHYRITGHVRVDLPAVKRIPVEAEGVVALMPAAQGNTAPDPLLQKTE